MTLMEEIEKFDFMSATVSALGDLCVKATSKEEAKRIIERYKTVNEFAEQNLGYIFGYYGEETRARLYRLFPVNHPIFGSGFGRGNEPTPAEAFQKGKDVTEGKK